MSAGRIVGYIGAAILIFFGVLFIWGAFSSRGGGFGWILVGVILAGMGFVLIYFAGRKPAGTSADGSNVTLKIDLPGDVKMESIKCKSCGGTLTMDNIQMVAGAPVVNCPYCKTTYQLTEEPKW